MHAVAAVVIAYDLVEIGVLGQRLAALHDEGQYRLPLTFAERCEGVGAPYLRQ